MKHLSIILLLSLTALLFSCSKDHDLKKSVMIYDTDYPDLPAYSEWGYNTFGAYYDREVFISNDREVPSKVIVTGNAMSFILLGQKGSYYGYGDSNNMEMEFRIEGFTPSSYKELLLLNDSILNLQDTSIRVEITTGDMIFPAEILSGQLHFKRAQNLLVDEDEVEVILSGYFDFKAIINSTPVTISNGRFDVGISPDNFYTY